MSQTGANQTSISIFSNKAGETFDLANIFRNVIVRL